MADRYAKQFEAWAKYLQSENAAVCDHAYELQRQVESLKAMLRYCCESHNGRLASAVDWVLLTELLRDEEGNGKTRVLTFAVTPEVFNSGNFIAVGEDPAQLQATHYEVTTFEPEPGRRPRVTDKLVLYFKPHELCETVEDLVRRLPLFGKLIGRS